VVAALPVCLREGNCDLGRLGSQQLAIEPDGAFPAGIPSGDFLQLHPAQSRAKVINAVVIAEGNHVVGAGMPPGAVPGQCSHAVRAQALELFCQLVILGQQHAAFASGQVFIAKEAKAANIAPGAEGFPLQRSPYRMGSIFDDHKVMLAGNFQDGGHIAGIAGVVHHHDCLRLRGYCRPDRFWGKAQPISAFDICKNRRGAGIADRIRTGNEGQGRQDDLIAWPEVKRQAS